MIIIALLIQIWQMKMMEEFLNNEKNSDIYIIESIRTSPSWPTEYIDNLLCMKNQPNNKRKMEQ